MFEVDEACRNLQGASVRRHLELMRTIRTTPTTLAALTTLIVLVGATGCRRHTSSPDNIVMVIEGTLSRLDPRYAATAWDVKISSLIAPGLTGLKERGRSATQYYY